MEFLLIKHCLGIWKRCKHMVHSCEPLMWNSPLQSRVGTHICLGQAEKYLALRSLCPQYYPPAPPLGSTSQSQLARVALLVLGRLHNQVWTTMEARTFHSFMSKSKCGIFYLIGQRYYVGHWSLMGTILSKGFTHIIKLRGVALVDIFSLILVLLD